MMQVLQLIRSINPKDGGTVNAVLQLHHAFEALDYTSHIATLDNPLEPWLDGFPAAIALGPVNSSYGLSFQYMTWLRRNAKDYALIIVHGLWQFPSFAALSILPEQKVPYFVFPHGMLDPWFKENYPLKHLKKVVYWLLLERRFIKTAQAILYTSEQERTSAKRTFPAFPSTTEKVVTLGAAPPSVTRNQLIDTFFKRFEDLSRKKIIIFLGRFHEKKGIDIVLESFAKCCADDSALHLVMAGPDDDNKAEELKALSGKLGIKHRITWAGMLTGEIKWGALAAAELFFLPSHQENFGIAVVEALSMGTPVLISDKVNIWEIIITQKGGLVCDDIEKSATDSLKAWVSMPPEQKKVMRENAFSIYSSCFDVKLTAQQIVQLVQPLY